MALFNPDDYTTQPDLNAGGHEADSFMQRGGIVGTIRSLTYTGIVWYVTKFLFYITAVAIASWLGFVQFTNKDLDEVSTHLASGGLEPVIEKIKEKGNKSTYFNRHPYFQSEWAEWFEQEHGVNPREIYQFARKDDFEYLIMKDVFMVKGKPLVVEDSNLFSKDAETYCDTHGGYVAKEHEAKKVNVKRAGEGFSDKGWSGKKMFRCTIIDLGGAK
jgi:hypothetical protein